MALTKEDSSRGGKNTPPEKKSFSRNRELARAAGRKGGLSTQQKQLEKFGQKGPETPRKAIDGDIFLRSQNNEPT